VALQHPPWLGAAQIFIFDCVGKQSAYFAAIEALSDMPFTIHSTTPTRGRRQLQPYH